MSAPAVPDTIDEAAALADTLAALVGRIRGQGKLGIEYEAVVVDASFDQAQLVRYAAKLYRSRRVRDRLLEAEELAIGEPTWDMLLDLFVADGEGRQTSVTSLTLAGYAPPTTGSRHVGLLHARALISSEPDPTDGRRRFVALSDHGRTMMTRCLSVMLADDRRR